MSSPEILIPIDPLENLPVSEELGMEVAAFLGAIDDLFEEFTGNEPDKRADEEIMRMVVGIRDQSSKYYSEKREYALNIMEIVSQRLGEMACNHDHFRQSLEAATGEKFVNDAHDHHSKGEYSNRKHSDDDDGDDEEPSDLTIGSKRRRRKKGDQERKSYHSKWTWFSINQSVKKKSSSFFGSMTKQ